MVKTICDQCGDRGFSEALIYCDECQIAAVHRYCLAVMPADFEEHVIWYCLDCEQKVAELSSKENLNSLPARNCGSGNFEIVQETQSEKNDINEKNLERRDCIESFAKADVCQGEISPSSHLELHYNVKYGKNKDQKFSRQGEQDGSNSIEEAESVRTKATEIDIRDCKNNLGGNCSLHCSEGDKNNKNLERQIESDGSSSHKEIEPVKGKTPPLVTNDPADILQHYDLKRPIMKVQCSENEKGDTNFKRHKVLIRDGSDEEIESVEPKDSLVATSNSLNIPTPSSNACSELTTEVHCNQNEENAQGTRRQKGIEQGSSTEEVKSAKHETSLVVTSAPSNVNNSIYVPAQPIFEPIWNGSFYLSNEKFGTVGGLVAHLSTMASSRVFEEAKRFPGLLCLDLLSRSDVWPNNFNKCGPSDDNIALYLFPNNDRDEKVYDSLVDDMISHDLAMRAVLENAELLVFTSIVLPIPFWRFESKFYLWGVFRGKQVSPVQETQFAHAITCYPQSLVSPLNDSEKNDINRLKQPQSIDNIDSLAKAEVHQGYISPASQLGQLLSNSSLGWKARREVVRAFTKLKMKAGESVKDHMMKVSMYVNDSKLLGVEIGHQTEMDMITNTLSDSFAEFKINYELNKKEYTLTRLVDELREAEKILLKKKHEECNIIEATPKSWKNGKRKWQKFKNKGKLAPRKNESIPLTSKGNLAPVKKNRKKEAKPTGNCFHCGAFGHWKRDCQVYLAQRRGTVSLHSPRRRLQNRGVHSLI